LLDLAPAPPESAHARGRSDLAPGAPESAPRRTWHSDQNASGSAADSSASDIQPAYSHGPADERLIAGLRFGGAAILLVLLLSGSGDFHSPAVRALAAGYVCYAGVALLISAVLPHWLLRHTNAVHAIDFIWTSVASTVGGGPNGHVSPFFVLVLAAAAFRWGLARTLFDGALVLLITMAQTGAAIAGLTPWAFELDLFLVSATYLGLGTAVLFGTLADRLHMARRQALVTAGLVSRLNRASGIGHAVADTLATIVDLLKATRVILVVEELHTGTLMLWRSHRKGNERISTSVWPLAAAEARQWLLAPAVPAPSELIVRGEGRAQVAIALSTDRPRATEWLSLPAKLAEEPASRVVLAFPFGSSGVWNGQLYIFDPRAHPRGEARLRFLSDLLRHVTPGLINLYLVRRLRSRAESLERARISRELHDGILQSLAGLEMRLEVLRRQAAPATPDLAREIAEIQGVIHGESLDVRQVMQRLRPTEVDARHLPAALSDLVQRFSRASEIGASLDWTVSRLALPPHHCSEVMRIVQEALFNVRRHSGATRVTVRVEADADAWALIVEDNGRGLGFTGRLTHEELETHRKGPRVIRERTSAIGGSLAVESSERGARLELTFPRLERD
jgi:signal transduction histidine kinase